MRAFWLYFHAGPSSMGWFQFLNRTEQACSGSYDDSCETRGSALGPQSLLGFLWRGLCIRFFLKPKRITHHTTAELKQLFFFPKKRGEDEEATPTDRRAMQQRSLLHPRSSYAYFLKTLPSATGSPSCGCRSELLPPRQGDPPILTDRPTREGSMQISMICARPAF